MKRRDFLKTAAAGLFIPVAPAIIRPASAQMWPSPGPGRAAIGGGGYTGPGDVASGAYAWWGLRAYSAATAAANANCVQLCTSTGTATTNFTVLSDGSLDIASINSWITTNSAGIPRVLTWYDQSGGGRNVTRAFASAPHLIIGAVGSFPASILYGGGKQHNSAAGFTIASQPITVYSGALITSAPNIGCMLSNSSNFEFAINTTPALRLKNNTATAHATTLSTSTWYALQGVYDGASSVATVNTTNTTVSPGTTGLASSTMSIGSDGFSQALTGSLVELGIWSGNITSPVSNLRTYGGF